MQIRDADFYLDRTAGCCSLATDGGEVLALLVVHEFVL
jgi:hypothetical protein